MHRRQAAAVALSAALLLSACTDNAPQPPPPPSDGPTMPSTTPTASTSPTPSGNAEQTVAAVIKNAYRTQFDEVNRLDIHGGTTKLTPALLKTTSGQHRKNVLTALSGDKKAGIHQVGRGILVGVAVGSGTATQRSVTACEDYSHAKWIKQDGSKLPVQEPLRYLQHATVKKAADGKWRVDYVKTKRVTRFSAAVCNGDKK